MQNDVIKRILDIDKQAKEKLKQAEQDRINIIAAAKNQEEALINEGIAEAEEKLNIQAEKEQDKINQKLAELEKYKSDEIAHIDSVYQSNWKIWEDEIFDNITNVQ